MMRPLLYAVCLCLPLPLSAAHYYVKTGGSDGANGLSPVTAWATVSKVNAGSYSPGDTISFNGGDTFSGTTLSPTLTGSSGNIITVNSYGTGRGIIDLSNATPGIYHGISLTNPQYVTIDNLEIKGSGWTGSGLGITVLNGGNGILIVSNLTSGPKLDSISITNCYIHGYYYAMWIEAGKTSGISTTIGFNNLLIDSNTLTNNLNGPLLLQGYHTNSGGLQNQITNVTITHNFASNAPGDPNSGAGGIHGTIKTEAGGFGIGNVTGATISYNFVGDSGGFGGALTGLAFGGSAGIVAANSSNVAITHNEVARMGCSTHYDGMALDLDQDTDNSEVAYNLTYNNVGPAFGVGSYGGTVSSSNRIHHNVSINDVRGNNTGGTSEAAAFFVWGNTDSTDIFSNTIYVSSTGVLGVPACFGFAAANSPGNNTNARFINNICKVTGGIGVFHANSINFVQHLPSITALGNVYDPSGGSLVISNDNGSSYTNITTLAGWRALGSGYENLSAVNYGTTSTAYLRDFSLFSPPSPNGYAGASIPINGLGYFDPGGGSSAVAEGINPSLIGLSIGTADYHGNAPSRAGGTVFDAGAVSYLSYPSSQVEGMVSITGLSSIR